MTKENITNYTIFGLLITLIILMIVNKLINWTKLNKGRHNVKANIFLNIDKNSVKEIVHLSRVNAKYALIKIAILIALTATCITLLYVNYKTTILPLIAVLIGMLILSIINMNYKNNFRKTVIQKIMKNYNPNYKYSSFEGISYKEYKSCLFTDTLHGFTSADMTKIPDLNYEFSWVKCERTYKGSEDYQESIDFLGAVGKKIIKNTECEIYIDTKEAFELCQLNMNKLNKLTIGNEKFDKQFNVYVKSENKARQILNKDMIETLLEINEKIGFNMNIRILNNALYVRFAAGQGIAPNLWSSYREENSVLYYLSMLECTLWVCNTIEENIE